MKGVGIVLFFIGIVLISIAGYQFYQHHQGQKQSLAEATIKIQQGYKQMSDQNPRGIEMDFTIEDNEAFALLEIPKLDKTLPIVEGADPDALQKGVGHVSNTAFPGQNEQIVLSGHRDTVFRDFGKIEIGDKYIITTPYGTFTYEIKETEIVSADDTTVIRDMGEEVLVVSTCYPFRYIGDAPDRFVTFAYPVEIIK